MPQARQRSKSSLKHPPAGLETRAVQQREIRRAIECMLRHEFSETVLENVHEYSRDIHSGQLTDYINQLRYRWSTVAHYLRCAADADQATRDWVLVEFMALTNNCYLWDWLLPSGLAVATTSSPLSTREELFRLAMKCRWIRWRADGVAQAITLLGRKLTRNEIREFVEARGRGTAIDADECARYRELVKNHAVPSARELLEELFVAHDKRFNEDDCY